MIVLDGKRMCTKDEAHRYLKEQLDLPAYYGHNLDALWDLLSERSTPTDLLLRNMDECIDCLGDYGLALFRLLQDAEQSNRAIHLHYEED